jgi:lipopolysaccharide transport system ATP-binding protein
MSDIAIAVEELGKSYLLDHQSGEKERYLALRDVLVKNIIDFGQKTFDMFSGKSIDHGGKIEEFWALKDINFEIRQGQRVGIIGRNGAGKSTLLKILSRITEPTTGRVKINGRVASLLEVGTGFHPELTGRQNIFLNGAILGMSRKEILKKFDQIVDFAEVEKFLDTPVKRYSSGMYVRLAFAVAAHLESEILVVDEVLAVGDMDFQKKCLGKMEEVTSTGRTVLFVSHNMSAISSLCPESILLREGGVAFYGDSSKALQYYIEAGMAEKWSWTGAIGNETGRLSATWVAGQKGLTVLHTATQLTIGLRYTEFEPVEGLIAGFWIYSEFGQCLLYSLYDDSHAPPTEVQQPGVYEVEFELPANFLAGGSYKIKFDLGVHNRFAIADDDESSLLIQLHNISGLGRRHIITGEKFTGLVRPKLKVKKRQVLEGHQSL